MLSINGIFLYKLFALSVLHDLFEQKHLSTQITNSSINKYFQLIWINSCGKIIKHKRLTVAMELVDFLILIFKKFSPCHRRVFINKHLNPQVFTYNVNDDENTGFSIKQFLKFLQNTTIYYESNNIKALRNEILKLLQHVDYIQTKTCKKTTIIQFKDYKLYRTLFDYLRLQFRLSDVNHIVNTSSIFIYAIVETPNNTLKYIVTV